MRSSTFVNPFLKEKKQSADCEITPQNSFQKKSDACSGCVLSKFSFHSLENSISARGKIETGKSNMHYGLSNLICLSPAVKTSVGKMGKIFGLITNFARC